MSDTSVQEITDALSKTSVHTGGVSFKGKSLVLNSEKDCDEVIEAINTCQDLQYLNLEGNTLGVEASKAISKALESKSELKRALWMDMFTGRMKEEIPRALENLGNGLTLSGAQLTELDLSDNAFGPIGVNGLAGLLSSQACYQLQVLKLNNNGLGSSGGKMLANALLECHKNSKREGKTFALRLFVAGRNRLENKGAAELAKVFETLGTLEEIVMPQNGIYHKGIKALSNSLKKNHNLKVLDLNDNTVTKRGAKYIAKALPYLQELKILNLGDCLLKTGGATVLANALADKHEHLEELHLSGNEIKSAGGLAVAKAVTNKNKLKQLNINGNYFGTYGRRHIMEDLQKSMRIQTLGGLSEDDSCDEDDESDESDESNEENGEPETEAEDDEEEEEVEVEEEGEEEEEQVEEEEEQVEEEEEEEQVEEEEEEEEEEADGEEKKEEKEKMEEEKKANGFPPSSKIMSNSTKQFDSTGAVNQRKNESMDVLSQAFSGLSMPKSAVGPIKTFLENPAIENFLCVTEEKINEFLKNNQDSSAEFYVDTFIPMLVKISSLSCCKNEEVEKLTSKVSSNMYKDLFTWASDKNQLSTVNNALFVHLGLIKSEDKNFKINWDVKASLEAIKRATSQGSVPNATQDILRCLLEKEKNRQFPEEIG